MPNVTQEIIDAPRHGIYTYKLDEFGGTKIIYKYDNLKLKSIATIGTHSVCEYNNCFHMIFLEQLITEKSDGDILFRCPECRAIKSWITTVVPAGPVETWWIIKSRFTRELLSFLRPELFAEELRLIGFNPDIDLEKYPNKEICFERSVDQDIWIIFQRIIPVSERES